MPQPHRTKQWQVILPDGWRVKSGPGDELVIFWNPQGIGTLAVITLDENKAPRNGQGQEFCGKVQGRTYEISSADLFVRHWTLLCGGQWIYVRYSCATKNAGLERAEVDEILQSISERV
jgi:hypothetical protein